MLKQGQGLFFSPFSYQIWFIIWIIFTALFITTVIFNLSEMAIDWPSMFCSLLAGVISCKISLTARILMRVNFIFSECSVPYKYLYSHYISINVCCSLFAVVPLKILWLTTLEKKWHRKSWMCNKALWRQINSQQTDEELGLEMKKLRVWGVRV